MVASKDLNVKAESGTTALEQTPFPIKTSGGRKYIRIELSSPVRFRLLTCKKGKIKLSKDRTSGDILNLSEGGMLLLTDSPVPTEGFMLLTLDLNKLVVLEGVLGKIKRVEPSGEGDFLVGVEFTSREELEKLASSEQIEHLPVRVASFDRKLREIISSYLRTAEIATR
ncbi:MAG: PilZ domain-containing protein [candidate division Zixibacteria bacterium]|nr:PilZ domain-containing protein [candidate division Zixibacteria bacterium]